MNAGQPPRGRWRRGALTRADRPPASADRASRRRTAPSPITGTTSRSRARVAATYASRCASACVARRFLAVVQEEIDRRPAAELQRAQVDRRWIEPAARLRPATACTSDRQGSRPGNSSPFALWTVIIRTPSLPSSRIGASAACAVSAATRSSSTKPRNEMPPPASYCRASSATCSTLASACSPAGAQHEPDVRARRVQQLLDGLGDRHVVAPPMQLLEQLQRRRDRREMRAESAGGMRNGWKMPKPLVAIALLPFEQLLVADREQRAAQRREHRQLVVRPLDRRERGADASRLPRDRETSCRRRAHGARRAPRARARTAASRPRRS